VIGSVLGIQCRLEDYLLGFLGSEDGVNQLIRSVLNYVPITKPTGLEFSSARYFIFNSVFFPDVKWQSFLLDYGAI